MRFHPNAEADYVSLGFDRAGAQDVIAWLSDDEFRLCLGYEDAGKMDDFLAPRKCPCDGVIRKLYVKLRPARIESEDCVFVHSFHKEKAK